MFDWGQLDKIDCSDESSLPALFDVCAEAHDNMSRLPVDLERAQYILDTFKSILGSCARIIESAGMFSRNEELDDVPTDCIRYFLVPFFQADTMCETREKRRDRRLKTLQFAKRLYMAFLSRCQEYQLVHPSAANCVQRLNSDERIDPQTARCEKIEQKRQLLAVEAKIKEIQTAQGTTHRNSPGSDEETERDLWVLKVHQATIKSVHAVGMLCQEVEVLQMSLDNQPCDKETASLEKEEERAEIQAAREAMREKLMEIANSLSCQRGDTRKDVFKPSHILPKYTVEQAGLMELKQLQAREQLAAQQAAIKQEEVIDSDEEIHMQRALDEWNDENPAGHGNSKLRPCAL